MAREPDSLAELGCQQGQFTSPEVSNGNGCRCLFLSTGSPGREGHSTVTPLLGGVLTGVFPGRPCLISLNPYAGRLGWPYLLVALVEVEALRRADTPGHAVGEVGVSGKVACRCGNGGRQTGAPKNTFFGASSAAHALLPGALYHVEGLLVAHDVVGAGQEVGDVLAEQLAEQAACAELSAHRAFPAVGPTSRLHNQSRRAPGHGLFTSVRRSTPLQPGGSARGASRRHCGWRTRVTRRSPSYW